MNHTIFNDIISYIDFLRDYGYCVMISSLDDVFAPYSQTLYKYRIHLPPICDFFANFSRGLGCSCISVALAKDG